MADPSDNPFDRVVDPWERVIEDVAATADQYRAAGRTVVELHPGDVAVVTGESPTPAEQSTVADSDADSRQPGFDVVVPGDEFDRVRSALADRSVDGYEVFRATGNGMAFLLIAVESGDDLAVLIPAYYDLGDRQTLEAAAREHGLYTHVRSLTGETAVTIEHEAPDPFFPD